MKHVKVIGKKGRKLMPGGRASTKGWSYKPTDRKVIDNKNSAGHEMRIGFLGLNISVLRLVLGFMYGE